MTDPFLSSLLRAIMVSLAMASSPQLDAQVVINEILAANQSTISNDGNFPDYVELINLSSQPVELSGLSLTDDPANPRAFVFPAGVSLAANARLLVWCDALSSSPGFHTGFALNANGEQVLLYASNGITRLDQVRFGPQITDLAIARVPDGTGAWVLAQPTPRNPNASVASGPPAGLRINEWMARLTTGEDWLELHNASDSPVVLDGLIFTDRLVIPPTNRPIPSLSFVAPRGYVQFYASDLARPDANHLDFKLSAEAETIRLFNRDRATILDAVTYGAQLTDVSQGRIPDGGTQIISFPVGTATPGAPNRTDLPKVVVSEVLTHADPPFEDAIELQNLGAVAVDVSHWWLSDSFNQPQKYRFPPGTSIAPHGFLVVYQYQFGAGPSGFALDSAEGDRVVLSAGDAAGNLTGAQTSVSFGALRSGRSAGRHATSTGVDFVPLSARTFGQDNPSSLTQFRQGQGASNAPPSIGPIVISEFHYHPATTGQLTEADLEFIELHNPIAATVNLYDPAYPTNTWRLRSAISFNLPFQQTLAPNAYALVVGFNPQLEPARASTFRSHYAVPSEVPLWGPLSGPLPNLGGILTFLRPDVPEGPDDPNAGFVPYEEVEAFSYSTQPPWPALPSGFSLHRVDPLSYANDPRHWLAAAPSPGRPTPTDQDDDGMPDAWEISNNLDPGFAGDASLDPDQDGATNLAEYRAGTDPHDPASVLKLEVKGLPPNQLRLRFAAVAGLQYELQSSDLQSPGSWQPMALLGPYADSSPRQLEVDIGDGLAEHYRLFVPQTP
ncbi:MAG: lamin tail domain-containing protein [Verrucomicrobia bacterium]|nr:lamin tail domain-containing protein [Verrucomicrobiota bacterium]